ncbi:MAG TPA: hypothetical protein VJP78_07075 [Thermoleophilia bacterium]|nr:hypothetical protein [Thermoleophilia bacterium]
MSCEKFGRERFEDELARYIEAGLRQPHGVLDVFVMHVPVGEIIEPTESGSGEPEDIVGIEVFIGALPLFSVRLHDWPLERSIEEDLGPRFLQALQLLLETCLDADRQLDDERREKLEAAERLEPDPQPQEHDHPCERGESP